MPGTTAIVTTWNLQGRQQPDLDDVAAVVRGLAPDVVALQEVQRRQARALSRRLGWPDPVWVLKHWPVIAPAEGLAILAPLGAGAAARMVLAHRWRLWSWRRRVAVAATVHTPLGPLRIVDVHLGAHVDDRERTRQASETARFGGDDALVVGDLNTEAPSPVLDEIARHGSRDAWAEVRDDAGATNWTGGPRAGRPPTQRLDYVFVPESVAVVRCRLPAPDDPGIERFAALSDHLPLTVDLASRDQNGVSGGRGRPGPGGRRWARRPRR